MWVLAGFRCSVASWPSAFITYIYKDRTGAARGAETVATGRAVYFSRSRGRLWRKGEESGHVQTVESIYVDCDADAILLKVRQLGPACHEGYRSCFFRQASEQGVQVAAERLVDPALVYRQPSGR